MAVGLLVTSLQWQDAIEQLVRVFFYEAQHQDLTVALSEAQSSEALRELERLPGVLAVEPARLVPARLRAGPRSQREAIHGVPAEAALSPIYDVAGFAVEPPGEGLVLSTKLAQLLAVGPGDRVQVEVLEGRRPTVELSVAATFETYIGTPAYMRMDALNRLMRERPAVNAAFLLVDPREERALFRVLQRLPEVSAVMLRRAAIDKFHETMAETMLIFVSFFAAFAAMLAFGVAYNSTRIALSERARELATLRVLGLSRLEISYILLGELGLLVLAGLPIGCAVGAGIAAILAHSFETDLYRVPLVIENSTFGFAMLVTLAATFVSGAIVRARLDRLDLIGVLKTRE
jgi:putative ABC transport system permease protein